MIYDDEEKGSNVKGINAPVYDDEKLAEIIWSKVIYYRMTRSILLKMRSKFSLDTHIS